MKKEEFEKLMRKSLGDIWLNGEKDLDKHFKIKKDNNKKVK
tara:strand:- start:180 stop:302 length:123 start_codon:yes stop_codon:yes gene_type:complete